MKIEEQIRTIVQTTIPAISPAVFWSSFNTFCDESALNIVLSDTLLVCFVTIVCPFVCDPVVEVLVVCNVNLVNPEDGNGMIVGVLPVECVAILVTLWFRVVEVRFTTNDVVLVDFTVVEVVRPFVEIDVRGDANFIVVIAGVGPKVILVDDVDVDCIELEDASVDVVVDSVDVKDVDIGDADVDVQGFCVGFGLIVELPSEKNMFGELLVRYHLILDKNKTI